MLLTQCAWLGSSMSETTIGQTVVKLKMESRLAGSKLQNRTWSQFNHLGSTSEANYLDGICNECRPASILHKDGSKVPVSIHLVIRADEFMSAKTGSS